MNKKILCIGDSLALPRPNVPYEDTWIYLLKNQFPNFDYITLFRRGITTNILVGADGNDWLEYYMPNIVIMQLGIVDCAPRLIKEGLERKIVGKLPHSIADKYINFLKTYRKRNPNNVYVSIQRFKENLRDYSHRCRNIDLQKLIIIKIPIPSKDMVVKNLQIIENVNKYNAIFDELSSDYFFITCISPLIPTIADNNIYVDGYHPNAIGNKLVYSEILKVLLSLGNK